MDVTKAQQRVGELQQALGKRAALLSNADPEWRDLYGQFKAWQEVLRASAVSEGASEEVVGK